MEKGASHTTGRDRGSFIATSLDSGGFLAPNGRPLTDIADTPALDRVYKSQSPLKPYPLNILETSPTKPPSPVRRAMEKNPLAVAGISLFALSIVATILISLLLDDIQNTPTKHSDMTPTHSVQSPQNEGND